MAENKELGLDSLKGVDWLNDNAPAPPETQPEAEQPAETPEAEAQPEEAVAPEPQVEQEVMEEPAGEPVSDDDGVVRDMKDLEDEDILGADKGDSNDNIIAVGDTEYCAHCGGKIDPGHAFCIGCGKQIK